MEITTDNYRAGAEYAARLEVEQRYKQQGYSVFHNHKIDEYTFDLYAEKGDDRIVFELIANPIDKPKQRAMEERRTYAKKNNIQYKVLLAPVPKAKKLYIEGLKETLEREFQTNIPDDLDALSPHTLVEEIEDIDVEEFDIKSSQEIRIKGNGEVMVTLCFDKEKSNASPNSFPFHFDGIWKFDKKEKISLDELNDLKFDTKSYYM